ncbi:membrane-spanning 4-domains subfamily A member 12-like [Hippopotamus amphibius kiboko]|uniref:membrane-spanning 4-domains subfamily A member 12-like n=1 Tax=Hippopotamus amphibius kiboko TaxID=575201 RepID=UPI002595CB8D|nr:membrane-spanning 4-domains subfamily A member 12-like [Hippopotamus amphibius kiboko]
MMSSKPTAYPSLYETTPNYYPSSTFTTPGSQQPLSFTCLGNQVQSGQPPFFTYPRIFTNSPQGQGNIQMVNPARGKAATNFKEEAKALGAIQIIIGLMHIGFGVILGSMASIKKGVWGFASWSFIIGYPFWGGLSFIITGALSVSASNHLSPCLIKSSLGMNILSSIFAIIGLILLLLDVSINGEADQDYWAVLAGKGISAMLIIFSLLVIFITSTTVHFTTQAINTTDGSVQAIPIMYANSPLTTGSSTVAPKNAGYETCTLPQHH